MPNQYTTERRTYLPMTVTGVTERTKNRVWSYGAQYLTISEMLVALAIGHAKQRPITRRGIMQFTGCSKRHTFRALKMLKARNVILVHHDPDYASVLGFTLNPETAAWQ